MATYRVGYFVGSLSSKSINRILSKALIRLAPDDMEFVEIPIRDLPLYSQDYDNDYPPEARALLHVKLRPGRCVGAHSGAVWWSEVGSVNGCRSGHPRIGAASG